MVKKIYYGPKYGTPFCFMSRLVKIVKFLKTLLKIRMVLHVIVGCAVSFVLKFLRTCPHLLVLYTHSILMNIQTQTICFQ